MSMITHNLLSQFTNRQLNITNNSKAKSSEKLSSGYRINRAADDAAGLAISEKMRSQVRGLHRASQNIQDGMSFLHVADGALVEVHNMLQRMNELTIQAANDSNTYSDRSAIQREINQLLLQIESVNTDTQFNTQPVFGSGTISEGTGAGGTGTGDVAPPAAPINDVTLSLPQGIDVAVNASNIDLLLHRNTDGSYELEDGHIYTFASDIRMTTFHASSGAAVTVKNSALQTCGIVCDNATLYISDVSIINTVGHPSELINPGLITADGFGYKGAPVTCHGSTTVNFLGNNRLIGGCHFPQGSNATDSCYAGIQVDEGNYLTLNGNGTLNASSGMGYRSISLRDGGGAGIGTSFSLISPHFERSGDITIHSGYIYAKGLYFGAGIGGGGVANTMRGDTGSVNGNIYIDGGFVHAEGGSGAGIGSGSCSGDKIPGKISISGGVVEASASEYGAGIGGGKEGQGAEVEISGGTVLASGGSLGSGIGSGGCLVYTNSQELGYMTSGNITISGGNVTAIGGRGKAVSGEYDAQMPSAIGQGGIDGSGDLEYDFWFQGFGNLTVDGRTEDMYMEGRSEKNEQGCYIYTYPKNQGQPDQPTQNPSAKSFWWIQMGATKGNGIYISTGKISLQDLGIDNLEVYSHQKASFAITQVQNAIDKVSAIRAHIGAQYNRLEHGMLVDDNTAENTQAAESRIRDTDIASEMVSLAKHNILQQAGQSMLTQANQIPSGVLKLLQ